MKSSGGHFLPLNVLHILNDGFQASLVLLLPFIAAAQNEPHGSWYCADFYVMALVALASVIPAVGYF